MQRENGHGKNPAVNRPRPPDIAERDTLDAGFSKGFGFHFHPNEAYWLDCHNHMETPVTRDEIVQVLNDWFVRLDAFRLGRVVAMVTRADVFPVCRDLAAQDPRFSWLFRVPYDTPDAALVQQAFDHGALGLKLHNAPLMRGEADHGIWLEPRWLEVFDVVNRAGKSLLWHITQRVSASPYHGGGAHAYWKEAAHGPTTSNEDLLETALEIARRHPDLHLLGAHQMHVGLDRLEAVFRDHPNVVIDTSCSFFLRWCDELYPEDRERLNVFFEKHSSRILFGTDSKLAPGTADDYQVQSFLAHARFIHQLRLTDPVLQQVAHGNAERVFRLSPLEPVRRYNSRP